jgi:O-antigen ligase
VALRTLAAPAALFVAVVAWIVFQQATSAPRLVHSPLWSVAGDALGTAVDGSISIDRDATMQGLVRLITAASVFWLALQFGRDATRANRLMVGIAAICTAYAAYGLFSFAIAPGNFLSTETRRAANFVSSTFYNRNNFATYAGLGAIIISGLLLRLYRRSAATAGTVRQRIAAFLEATGRGGAFHICALFIVVVAILLSGSRGGIISALFGGFVLLALTFTHRRKPASGQRDIVILVALIVAVVFVGFGDTFLGKISQQGVSDESRLAIYRLTIDSILESPLLGYGYGTFADVFPMFRDRSVDTGGAWLMAHNSYLEIVQGLGLLFGACLIVSVALLALRCILGAQKRKLNATLPYIAGSAACLIGASALVDFSLQIQAVTLTFMAVLGTGTAQSESSQRVSND